MKPDEIAELRRGILRLFDERDELRDLLQECFLFIPVPKRPKRGEIERILYLRVRARKVLGK